MAGLHGAIRGLSRQDGGPLSGPEERITDA
jgi:hypothetical protein